MKIFRFSLPRHELATIEMPRNALVLHVDVDTSGYPNLWALVDDKQPIELRKFYVAWTGEELPAGLGEYFGTIITQNLGLVLHVFEVGRG